MTGGAREPAMEVCTGRGVWSTRGAVARRRLTWRRGAEGPRHSSWRCHTPRGGLKGRFLGAEARDSDSKSEMEPGNPRGQL